ncbi:MAG TPA: ATP-grasp domain-containing protein [Candidatus Nanoarchaeia archaeon]|nr:ATP-grasp domain-containing protein [Candidatus Nanoarchaeia archaeon]
MRVGILYNLVDKIESGKELDKLADNEVLDTSLAVKAALERKGHEVFLERVSPAELKNLKSRYDIIFNLAEGIGSDALEEPKIAEAFEKAGLSFTGAGSKALALCLDKAKAKKIMMENGIPTPKYQLIRKLPAKISKELSFPLIIKPVHEDGSIGITSDSVVKDEENLHKKIQEIIEVYKQPALVEEYIDGREINVALFSNGHGIQALPLSEVVFEFPEEVPKIVSFDAKWVDDSLLNKNSVGKCPADVPEHLKEKLIELGKKAYQALGCSDYGRVDFRMKGEEIYALEVNPNPCINPQGAGFIRSANAAGYSYDDIINKILMIAVERNKVKQEIKPTPITV